MDILHLQTIATNYLYFILSVFLVILMYIYVIHCSGVICPEYGDFYCSGDEDDLKDRYEFDFVFYLT